MIGFSFRGRHSSSLNIGVRSADRTMRPPRRRAGNAVPGKHGIPFDKDEVYENRQIQMVIALINNDNWSDLRESVREVAEWLNGEGRLIFDDEPDKYYYASIYDGVGLEQMNLLPVGGAEITFEAMPFAYRLDDLTWDEAEFSWENAIIAWEATNFHTTTATGPKTLQFNNIGSAGVDKHSPAGANSKITITGSWTNITLSMNGETLSYKKAGSGTLVIDNVDLEIRHQNTNALHDLDGSLDTFLPIKPGPNSLNISGSGLNITLQLTYRPQWV